MHESTLESPPTMETASRPILMTRAGRAVLILGLALLLSSCFEDEVVKAKVAPEPAPEFALPLLGANAEFDSKQYAGKIVVLDFWATWCVPCEFQVPELNAFHEAHRADSDVVVYGVSVDTEGPDVVGAWIAEKGGRYPILLGSMDLALEFGITGFPTLVIIARDGTIDTRHAGLIQQSELEEVITRLRGAV
jgi:cytochrome c biogenesis protein CcmG/thiol:disulfide interchange protein DsbE